MAASSSSSYQRCTYDVFLSFRGEDTRKGFTDFLYNALNQEGIHTFRDDDEIPRGSPIQQELEKAIQESQLSIVVFSKDYASSRWCLDELVKINQRTKTGDGHIIIPVFYDVDPSDVRKQTGSFAEAFSRHEQRFKKEMNIVEEWRKALRDVPDLAGSVLGDGYQSKFIQDLVDEVWSKLGRKALYVDTYLVGVNGRVRGINKWLQDRSVDHVGIAVICGMGGIGKTTLATIAYNHNRDRFEGSCFLADVRERSEQLERRLLLQQQLLSDIKRNKKTKKPLSIDEGIERIKRAVSCKRVLIVFDDVDDVEQLSKILGDLKWFRPGSKIIITTRHKDLLQGHLVVYKMFQVEGLSESESFHLFYRHAFGQANPVEGFEELLRPLIEHCEGLPLALKVLGSSLSGQSREIWKDALKNLSENLNDITEGKIEKILKISFNVLQDRDKELFLHLACFFVSKKEDFAITILDSCGFSTRIGLLHLISRCLVKFDWSNKLVIHALLRDMAMEIIRRECPEDLGRRSRVLHKDAINILRKLTGTETIKGLMLMEDESSNSTYISSRKRCHIEDCEGNSSRLRRLGFFSWQPINFLFKNSTPESNGTGFKTEAFRRMPNLEILVLNNVKFSGGYEHFPKNLIWLCWSGFPQKSIPTNFSLAYVVALHLKNSSLEYVWKETPPHLPRLKILNLSHSYELMATPNFSLLPNLEKLVLKDCVNLVDIDESIGDLEKLVFLNMKNCKSLMFLPRSMFKLRSLQTFDLSGCSMLGQATSSYMENLGQMLMNSWQSIRQRPVLPSKNVGLSTFSLANLSNSVSVLKLVDCNISEISCFPSSLKELNLSDNPISILPENMDQLSMLKYLNVDSTNLRALPKLPPNLSRLVALNCKSLKRVTNLPKSLLGWHFWNCKNLEQIQNYFVIKPLRSIGKEMKQLLPQIGLFGFEYEETERDELVEMINFLTLTSQKLPSQAVYECGIFSTFLHGDKIPESFSCHKSSDGNSVLSITLPRLNSVDYNDLNYKIRGINICVVYGHKNHSMVLKFSSGPFLKVSNESKCLMWVYNPVTIRNPEEDEGVLWMSHWLYEDENLEVGDTICVSVDGTNCFLTKEFGVQIVFENEHKNKGTALSNSYGGGDEDVSMQLEVETVHSANSSSTQNHYDNFPSSGKYLLSNHNLYPNLSTTGSVFSALDI